MIFYNSSSFNDLEDSIHKGQARQQGLHCITIGYTKPGLEKLSHGRKLTAWIRLEFLWWPARRKQGANLFQMRHGRKLN